MDINDATWAIMREMSKLPYNVDDQQITRAKNQLKAQLLFAQDSPSGKRPIHLLWHSQDVPHFLSHRSRLNQSLDLHLGNMLLTFSSF